LKELTSLVKKMRQTKKGKSDQLIGFASARKTEENSLFTGVDEIFQEYGIKRAQYHGCDLSGGHLSILMTHSTKITEKVQTYLLLKFSKLLNAETPTPANEIATPVTTAEDEIRRTCRNVRTYLLLWDKVLLLVKTEYPKSASCDETQQRIGEIVELADKMGMKRSLKMHACMVHLVPQMRRFKCGLSNFDESPTELYYQRGYRMDVQFKHVMNE
jgi:hypothetical protein